jgi:poly(3-hydroxybutyrate) depolymerase
MVTDWQTAADNHGFLLMVPDHMNPNRSSFLHITGSSTLDVPATEAEMRDLLDCIYYGVGASYNVETTKIFWIGFSEGASFSDFAAFTLNRELRAVAPYAGGIGGKSLPVTRKIPVWAVCGTSDPIMWPAVSGSHQEWIDGGHPESHDWVAGVGHSFLSLCSQGPGPGSVYRWMADVICEPVVSGLP